VPGDFHPSRRGTQSVRLRQPKVGLVSPKENAASLVESGRRDWWNFTFLTGGLAALARNQHQTTDDLFHGATFRSKPAGAQELFFGAGH